MGLLDKIAVKHTTKVWIDFVEIPTIPEAEQTNPTKLTSIIFYAVKAYEQGVKALEKQAYKIVSKRNKIANFSNIETTDIEGTFNPSNLNAAKNILSELPKDKRELWMSYQNEVDEILGYIREDTMNFALTMFVNVLHKEKIFDDTTTARALWKMFNICDKSFAIEVRKILHEKMITYYSSNEIARPEWFDTYLYTEAAFRKISIEEYYIQELSKIPETSE